jgi:hypothetical protein
MKAVAAHDSGRWQEFNQKVEAEMSRILDVLKAARESCL